jgi:peptidoglycan/LPS O-acetylase OafA/YrhL
MSTKPAYRADVDGLRAVAVLGVLLYHYGASWLPGGFTGVDVFFVISGYLITLILRREIDAGEYTLLGFYDRRIRRIFPALLVVLAFTLAMGWFTLLPGDFSDLGQSTGYAAIGLGNLFFFWNTGYFDQASEMQPLLHTWSLGVEEQFYVVWPLLLLVGLKFITSMRLRALLIGLCVAGGFAYAATLVSINPKAAFYLPYPRAWELGLGALLVFLPTIGSVLWSQVMSLSGAGLIAFSFLALSATDPFPGANALFATVGAALLIMPKAGTVVGAALSWRPAVAIGLISYSLYLWHWPILVLYRHYANGAMPSVPAAIALGVLSIALAYLSWRYVEQPFRKPLSRPFYSVVGGFACAGLIALAGSSIAMRDGVPQRLSPELAAVESLEVMWEWDCSEILLPRIGDVCTFGANWDDADVRIALWGDSHAEHMAPLLKEALPAGASVILYRGCQAHASLTYWMVHKDIPDYREGCARTRDRMLTYLSANPVDWVVLSGSWTSRISSMRSDVLSDPDEIFRTAMKTAVSDIEATGARVLVIGDIPGAPEGSQPSCFVVNPGLLRAPCQTAARTRDQFERGHTYELIAEVAESTGASALLPGDNMCASGTCIFTLGGQFLYRDSGHFRRNLDRQTLADLAKVIGLTDAAQELTSRR